MKTKIKKFVRLFAIVQAVCIRGEFHGKVEWMKISILGNLSLFVFRLIWMIFR
jgi:hypothetical protein